MKKQVLGSGRFVTLIEQNGWEYAERPGVSGIVAIVPITTEGELVLVEQFRVPVATTVIELPAGLAGDAPGFEDEPLLEAAKRELVEETGYSASSWRFLIDGPPSPGISTEVVSWFLATDLEKTGPGGGEGSEQITVHQVPLADALSWLRERRQSGVMIDPKIFLGLYFANSELG